MDKGEKNQSNSENHKYTDEDSQKAETQFNAGSNDSDYDGGHPEDALIQRNKLKEKQQTHLTDARYNAGGNDSDYDGGHPEDALIQRNKLKEKQQTRLTDAQYNAGGNDSDYDGGHPEDVDSKNEGHVNPKDKD